MKNGLRVIDGGITKLENFRTYLKSKSNARVLRLSKYLENKEAPLSRPMLFSILGVVYDELDARFIS